MARAEHLPPCGFHFGSRFRGRVGPDNGLLSAAKYDIGRCCEPLRLLRGLRGEGTMAGEHGLPPGNLHWSPGGQLAAFACSAQRRQWAGVRRKLACASKTSLRGPYKERGYEHVHSLEAFEPWLLRQFCRTFQRPLLEEAFQQMPSSSWCCADTEAAFGTLRGQLMRRRETLGGVD